MLRIIRRPLALKDFKDIWHYTYNKWGEKQANKYVNKLNMAVNGLALQPKKGKKSNVIHDGVYVYRVERHVILYYFDDSTLTVSRILT